MLYRQPCGDGCWQNIGGTHRESVAPGTFTFHWAAISHMQSLTSEDLESDHWDEILWFFANPATSQTNNLPMVNARTTVESGASQ